MLVVGEGSWAADFVLGAGVNMLGGGGGGGVDGAGGADCCAGVV